MTDAQTEARAIVAAALPPHEQAMLGGDAIVVLADLIAAALSAERAAHAETKRELLEMEKSQMRQAAACGVATARYERAEAGERAAHDAANTAIRQRDEARAQLAEARKALGEIEQEARSLPLHTSAVTREHVLTSKLAVVRAAARRALEAQGGENG